MNNISIERVIEDFKFGIGHIHDADKNKILNILTCSHCGKEFESENYPPFCPECRNKIRSD